MTSLSEKLAAKARRSSTVDIPVTDPGDDLRRRAAEATRQVMLVRALVDANGPVGEDGLDAVLEQAQAVVDEYASHYVTVAVQALPADEWEALLNEHATDDGDLAASALPEMLARCIVDDDPNVHDPAWWADALASGAWSFGDREALKVAVLDVNAYAPRPSLGKG